MNLGIIGTGNIANEMAKTLIHVDDINVIAVASRKMETAKVFAEKYHIQKTYDSYDEFAKDPEIDLVYVATPHTLHYEHTMICLKNKKPVLCEKPFALSSKDAADMIQCARDNQIFLCEAMWLRFMPLLSTIQRIIESGIIGEPILVLANKGECYNIGASATDASLGGGSLFGNGIYSLTDATLILGTKIKKICGQALWSSEANDGANGFILTFEDNKMAIISSSLMTNEHNAWYVCGDKGIMEITGCSRLKTVDVYNNKRELIAHYDAPKMISGYEYEVIAAKKALDNMK